MTDNTVTVPKRLLKDDAYDRIKRMIIEGALRPGELLSERKLGKSLGISGSPVRAAIERLGMEGLVCVSPQRGTFVLDLSFTEITEQFEFRMVLEPHIAAKLSGKLTDEQSKQLRKQLSEQRKSAGEKKRNLIRDVELDMEFHLLLCEYFGNREMTSTMLRMQDKITRAVLAVNWRHENRLPDSIREHASIAKAIIEGDSKAASQRMKEHLEFGRNFLISGGRD